LRVEVFEEVPAATFLEAENTPHTNQAKSENVRIRFLIKNNGPDPTGSRDYRLQFGQKVGTICDTDESYLDVPNQASCGSSEVCMIDSSYFTDQEATSNISPGLTDPAGTFVAGKLVEDPSNEATSLSLANGEFTELEYNFQFTTNASDSTDYCFRVSLSGNPLDIYTNVAEIQTAGVVISISISPTTIDYGGMLINTTKASGIITVSNESSQSVDLNIMGADAEYQEATGEESLCTDTAVQDTCTWTLSSALGTDQYIHAYTTDTTLASGGTIGTNPSIEWVDLATTYKTLATGIAAGATQDFQLDMRTPSTAGGETAYGKQYSTTVTVQAVAP
jgi:hypothetical protein